MSTEFIIRTVDNEYSYTSSIPVGVTFNPKNNLKTSDTQGFLRKVNKGKIRHEVEVIAKVSKTDYEDTLLPMFEYVDDVQCTFDRDIPMRGSATGTFTFEDMQLVQEFTDNEYEVKILLVEILSQ